MVPVSQKGKLGSLNQVLAKKQAEKVQTSKTNPYLNAEEGKGIKAEQDGRYVHFIQETMCLTIVIFLKT